MAAPICLIVNVDGACRGNPGPMAIGVSISDPRGEEVGIVSTLIGHGTNNIAEYRAAIEGIKKARELGATRVIVNTDSQLLANQTNGVFKVGSTHIRVLHAELLKLLNSLEDWKMTYVPRNENQRADELANLAYENREESG